ncbi:MAG TPA: family 3 encapsulin nanocompartment shell protein [Jatrophihabitans sp.]|nr:family 3 encapsulin nanocompartment shell protein [Jatrophihabitans sp.]
MQATDTIKRTIAEVVADRKNQLSPGRQFLQAVLADGEQARVDFDVTITDSLTSSRRKPRYPTRNMLKVVDLSRDPRKYYWHETPRQPDDPAIADGELRPELGNHFHSSPIPELLTTTAWVQVPPGLGEDPEAFESFINYRLIVRLGTAENHTILCGPEGLLNLPQIGRLAPRPPFSSAILAACDEVEQQGCTADGLVLNPLDYYRYLETGQLMQTLEQNGVFIVRTRLVEPGQALVGDFGHGAQLFDAGRSRIQFAEPPPGTFAEPGLSVKAEIYERVVVNLPTTFYLVSL